MSQPHGTGASAPQAVKAERRTFMSYHIRVAREEDAAALLDIYAP